MVTTFVSTSLSTAMTSRGDSVFPATATGNRNCYTEAVHSVGGAAWAQVSTRCRMAGKCRVGGAGGLSEFLTTQLPDSSVIFLTFCCKMSFLFWHECCSVTVRFC